MKQFLILLLFCGNYLNGQNIDTVSHTFPEFLMTNRTDKVTPRVIIYNYDASNRKSEIKELIDYKIEDFLSFGEQTFYVKKIYESELYELSFKEEYFRINQDTWRKISAYDQQKLMIDFSVTKKVARIDTLRAIDPVTYNERITLIKLLQSEPSNQ